MRKSFFYISLALITACSVIFSFSLSQAADMKIGCVNMQKIVKESTAGKEMSQEGNKILGDKKAEIRALEDEISKMFNDYKEKEMVLSPEAKKELKDNIERKLIDKDRSEKDLYRQLRNFEKRAVSEIVTDINKIIKKIGKDEKYTLLLDSSGIKNDEVELPMTNILYSTPELNITEKVLSLYNKQYEEKKKKKEKE